MERAETETPLMIPNIRQQGGIEYFESDERRYTGQELALPDADCDGQEKPIEFEPCPNLPICEESIEISSEGHRFDNDFNDYQLGVDELLSSQNYPKEKYDRKTVPAVSKKPILKKQKRKRKKERVKKIRNEDVEELNVLFRKGHNYKHVKSHALNQMRYNSHNIRHEFLL